MCRIESPAEMTPHFVYILRDPRGDASSQGIAVFYYLGCDAEFMYGHFLHGSYTVPEKIDSTNRKNVRVWCLKTPFAGRKMTKKTNAAEAAWADRDGSIGRVLEGKLPGCAVDRLRVSSCPLFTLCPKTVLIPRYAKCRAATSQQEYGIPLFVFVFLRYRYGWEWTYHACHV